MQGFQEESLSTCSCWDHAVMKKKKTSAKQNLHHLWEPLVSERSFFESLQLSFYKGLVFTKKTIDCWPKQKIGFSDSSKDSLSNYFCKVFPRRNTQTPEKCFCSSKEATQQSHTHKKSQRCCVPKWQFPTQILVLLAAAMKTKIWVHRKEKESESSKQVIKKEIIWKCILLIKIRSNIQCLDNCIFLSEI